MTELDDATRGEILGELRAGRKISAIQRHRQATGASLIVAKRDVETLAMANGIAPGRSATRSSTPITFMRVLLVIAIVALIAVLVHFASR